MRAVISLALFYRLLYPCCCCCCRSWVAFKSDWFPLSVLLVLETYTRWDDCYICWIWKRNLISSLVKHLPPREIPLLASSPSCCNQIYSFTITWTTTNDNNKIKSKSWLNNNNKRTVIVESGQQMDRREFLLLLLLPLLTLPPVRVLYRIKSNRIGSRWRRTLASEWTQANKYPSLLYSSSHQLHLFQSISRRRGLNLVVPTVMSVELRQRQRVVR